jgi:hypothetical protein
MKPQVRAMSLALAVVALLSGTVAAGHLNEGVTSYTGCLVSKDGVIIKIKAGETPTSPCSGGQVQVHFSGGDITKISVTGALTGGGDNGEVTIGLKPEFTLPTGCVTGRVAEWDGSAWVCGIDNDTTYSEGPGLDLTGTTFSIEPHYRVKNTPDCSTGQFATGFDSAGNIACAAPASSGGVRAFANTTDIVPLAGVTRVSAIAPPAGKYLVFATVELINRDPDSESSALCRLTGPGGTIYQTGGHDVSSGERESLSMSGWIFDHNGGEILLSCTEIFADVDVEVASLIAIKVDSFS